jgi:hypothetical protein
MIHQKDDDDDEVVVATKKTWWEGNMVDVLASLPTALRHGEFNIIKTKEMQVLEIVSFSIHSLLL